MQLSALELCMLPVVLCCVLLCCPRALSPAIRLPFWAEDRRFTTGVPMVLFPMKHETLRWVQWAEHWRVYDTTEGPPLSLFLSCEMKRESTAAGSHDEVRVVPTRGPHPPRGHEI